MSKMPPMLAPTAIPILAPDDNELLLDSADSPVYWAAEAEAEVELEVKLLEWDELCDNLVLLWVELVFDSVDFVLDLVVEVFVEPFEVFDIEDDDEELDVSVGKKNPLPSDDVEVGLNCWEVLLNTSEDPYGIQEEVYPSPVSA